MNLTNNNRWFSTIANAQHWGPQGEYGYAPTAILTGSNGVVQSGAWVPIQLDSNGNLQVSVSNSANVNQKISSTGYCSGFAPFGGPQTIKGVQGYSKCASGVGFLQVYDGSTLVEPIVVQSGNNWFVNFGQNGAMFNNFSIQNSSDAVINQQYAVNDFFVTVIYQ